MPAVKNTRQIIDGDTVKTKCSECGQWHEQHKSEWEFAHGMDANDQHHIIACFECRDCHNKEQEDRSIFADDYHYGY